jgi:hypothetical protein
MKTTVYVLIALLAGLMLGSWSLKADLRKAANEIESLETQLAKQGNQPTHLEGISSMLHLPEAKPRKATARPAPPLSVSSSSTADTNSSPVLGSVSVTFGSSPHRHPTNSPSMKEQIETASNLWKLRVDLARNSFVSNVTTSEDQAVKFDVCMVAMNLRLSNSIRTWVDQIKQDKELTPEKSIHMINDLSSTLVWAYKDLDRSQSPDWREKAGPKFQIFDFINPDVALPFIEAGDVMKPGGISEAAINDTPGERNAP